MFLDKILWVVLIGVIILLFLAGYYHEQRGLVCYTKEKMDCFMVKLIPFFVLYFSSAIFIYFRFERKILKLDFKKRMSLFILFVLIFYALCLLQVDLLFTKMCS